MKYLMLKNMRELIESVQFKDEKNYILSLEKAICDNFLPILTNEKTFIILNEGVFYNKGETNRLFTEDSFLYFMHEVSLPFQDITAKYPNLIIIAGTILWKCKGKNTFFNTTIVFYAGKSLLSWDKQGLSKVDIPASENEMNQNYMRLRNKYWEKSDVETDFSNFYPCFNKPYLNPYGSQVLRPRFTFDSRKYEIIICKDIYTYYQDHDFKDTTIIYIANDGLIHKDTISHYPGSKIIYCDINTSSSITYKGTKPIDIRDSFDPEINKMFVYDAKTIHGNVICYED